MNNTFLDLTIGSQIGMHCLYSTKLLTIKNIVHTNAYSDNTIFVFESNDYNLIIHNDDMDKTKYFRDRYYYSDLQEFTEKVIESRNELIEVLEELNGQSIKD